MITRSGEQAIVGNMGRNGYLSLSPSQLIYPALSNQMGAPPEMSCSRRIGLWVASYQATMRRDLHSLCLVAASKGSLWWRQEKLGTDGPEEMLVSNWPESLWKWLQGWIRLLALKKAMYQERIDQLTKLKRQSPLSTI